MFLANAVQVQVALDLRGFGDGLGGRRGLLGLDGQFLVENALAEQNAIVANVNARSLDQLFYFRVGFPAEATQCDVGGACHKGYL
jgi:hypothetical protein